MSANMRNNFPVYKISFPVSTNGLRDKNEKQAGIELCKAQSKLIENWMSSRKNTKLDLGLY